MNDRVYEYDSLLYERPLKNISFFRFKFQIHTKNPPVSIILVDFL